MVKKALLSKDPIMRQWTVYGLREIGGTKARDMILFALRRETDSYVRGRIVYTLQEYFTDDPMAQKVLRELAAGKEKSNQGIDPTK